jgi:hypothetical protein
VRSVAFATIARLLQEQFTCGLTCVASPRALIYANRPSAGLYFFTRMVGNEPMIADILVPGGEDEQISSLVVESLLRNRRINRQQFWRLVDAELS